MTSQQENFNRLMLRLKAKPFIFDYQTQMDKLRIQERARYLESFKKVFTEDISDMLFSDIQHRISGEIDDNLSIFIFGDKGSFKSSIALQIALLFQPDFDVNENLVFTNKELKERMQVSKKGAWFIRDETVKDFGTGSKQLESDIQMFTETLRKRKNSLLFLSPNDYSFGALDYIFHTFKGNLHFKEKQACFGIIDPNQHGKYIGSGRIFLDWHSKVWKEYSKVKDEYLERFAKADFQTYSVDAEAKKIMSLPEYHLITKKKELGLLVRQTFPHAVSQFQEDIMTKVWQLRGDAD